MGSAAGLRAFRPPVALWRVAHLAIACSLIPSAASNDYKAPSLKQMKKRAKPWKAHLKVQQAWEGAPNGFILRGLLSKKEIDNLLELAKEGMLNHQEGRGNNHATVALDKAPQLNNSAYMRVVNERLSALSGLPVENIEEGYFSVYNTGYQMKSIHLDNHHALFEPTRVVSVVIYLMGESEGLVGGGTVFPLVGRESAEVTELVKPDYLNQWQTIVRDTKENFQMGMEPQRARICTDRDIRPSHDPICDPLVEAAKELCSKGESNSADGPAKGGGAIIRARPGDAIMFSDITGENSESVRAMHGGCTVQSGNKVILSKFIRSRARPWVDEDLFSKALDRWREVSSKPKDLQWQDGDQSTGGWNLGAGAGGANPGFREDDDEWEEEDENEEEDEEWLGKALDELEDEL